jgi:hypothetical protein
MTGKIPQLMSWYDFMVKAAEYNGWDDANELRFGEKVVLAIKGGELKARDKNGFPQGSDSLTLPFPPDTVFVTQDEAVAWMKAEGPFSWGLKQYTPKQQQQEDAILRIVSELGFNPKAFPKYKSGHQNSDKSGIKIKALKSRDLFTSEGVFNKAWERLRANGEIVDEI